MIRRDFLKQTGLASTALLMPQLLRGFNTSSFDPYGKTLIVVQLGGGNDGLNTIVPHGNDIYYQNRPTIAIPKKQVIQLDDMLGLNPALSPLRDLYDAGEMAILNSVGYPEPDRSHFRSMDIWQSGSGSKAYWSSGWLGRYLDQNPTNDPFSHLEVNDQLSLAMKGKTEMGFAMQNAQKLGKSAQNRLLKTINDQHQEEHDHHAVSYLYQVLANTQESADYLLNQSQSATNKVSYPKTKLGGRLQQVAKLMLSHSRIRVFYVAHNGFDTHANQKNTQTRLLNQYAEAMAALRTELKKAGIWKDTLILTFSEFGRRVAQNGSRGTDHGAANNVFVMGGDLANPGIQNAAADLQNLDRGDLKHEIDFRQVYATILDKWMQTDSQAILGQSFDHLRFV